jgi:hypothetical protein
MGCTALLVIGELIFFFSHLGKLKTDFSPFFFICHLLAVVIYYSDVAIKPFFDGARRRPSACSL